jgi:poly(A) polymerase
MQKAARRIVERLRLHGHEAFFAGGWVRDYLLRRKPDDIDIATSALPEQIVALFPNSLAIGAQFGVVQVRMYRRAFEVATFRTEGPYLDGRHPSTVAFSGPKQDACRRDFTINGLFYDPVADRVIDYVLGKTDLQHRTIRTIGDPNERFSEDKLRIIRAIRLAAALDFGIAPETWKAIQHLAAQILLVSWERIRNELIKILTGPAPDKGLDLLAESGILAHILPEVAAMRGVLQPPEFHPEGDVFVHTKNALALLHKPSPVLALGTLLHDVGKPPSFTVKERIRFDGHVELGGQMAAEICRRLKISRDETAAIVELVLHHLHFMHVKEMRQSTLKRFLRLPNFSDHLELHRVDCMSSHRDLEYYNFCHKKLEELKNNPVVPLPLVNGRDLIDLGYRPGPVFKKILHSVEDLQLEGLLLSREDALEYIKKSYPPSDDSGVPSKRV